MSDAPIEPQDFANGVKVVDIGDLRIARGLTRRPRGTCPHRNMVYDDRERRIWCNDCESEVEAFDAFKRLCEAWSGATSKLQRRQRAVEEAEHFTLRSRAAKAMDVAWRKRNTAPGCPHCHKPLLPQDMLPAPPRVPKSSPQATTQDPG